MPSDPAAVLRERNAADGIHIDAITVRRACPHPVDAALAIRYKTIVGEHLFVVSRQQLDLYRYLSREFSAESDVVVVLDRRYGERRNRGERRATPRGERRQTDRRGEKQIGGQINTLGYAFVRLD